MNSEKKTHTENNSAFIEFSNLSYENVKTYGQKLKISLRHVVFENMVKITSFIQEKLTFKNSFHDVSFSWNIIHVSDYSDCRC